MFLPSGFSREPDLPALLVLMRRIHAVLTGWRKGLPLKLSSACGASRALRRCAD
jgi:hypothetical protein